MIEPHDRVRHPALLIVDMQNDFVRVGAALEVVDARATIPANQALIRLFRERKLPIVYTKFITFPAPVLLWEWSPQALPPTKCCWKGHKRFYPDIGREQECTDVIDELAPLPGEFQVEKYNYGAFHATQLEPTLRFAEHMGNEVFVHADIGNLPVTARVPAADAETMHARARGSALTLHLQMSSAHLFDAATGVVLA